MQIIIKNTKNNTIYNLMRDLSYHLAGQDKRTGELNFTHPIRGNAFPRFHVYLKIDGENISFNLHLDQRAPIYHGTIAHEGEYSGPLIEEEAKRIKQFFEQIL
jgi:hypothetical protein